MKKLKEYICVISATILHGIVTYSKLGSMPHISFEYFDKISITAFCLWAVYGTILHVVAQQWVINETRRISVIKAGFFGLVTALAKGIIDFIIAKITLNIESMKMIVIIDGVVTLVFGAMLIFVIVCVVSKKRIVCILQKMKLECGILLASILIYMTMVVINLLKNAYAIDALSASWEEKQKLDYHFAIKIADGNVFCYIIFYTVFWYFIRKVTENCSEVGDISISEWLSEVKEEHKKELKEFLCIVAVTFLHGLITYFKLGGMPQIFFLYFDKSSALAIMIWAMYVAVLYLCVQGLIFKLRFSEINWYQLVGVVAGTPFIKGSIDLFIEKIMAGMESVMHIVVLDGIVNFVFGALLMETVKNFV